MIENTALHANAPIFRVSETVFMVIFCVSERAAAVRMQIDRETKRFPR